MAAERRWSKTFKWNKEQRTPAYQKNINETKKYRTSAYQVGQTEASCEVNPTFVNSKQMSMEVGEAN